MATEDNASPLLALTLEVLGLIINSLEPESLLMLRLTCKVLENVTYDRFTKTYFEQRFCCIYYEPRWLLMKAVLSSRLASRVRSLYFTSEPLEGSPYTDLQLAPDIVAARIPAAQTDAQASTRAAQMDASLELSYALGPQTQIPTWPNTAIFNRVFRDIKAFAPNALVAFDFLESCLPVPEASDTVFPAKAETLVAAVTAQIAIDKMWLNPLGIHWFNHVLTHLKPELMASTSALHCFTFDGEMMAMRSDHREFIIAILNSSNALHQLNLMGDILTKLPYDLTMEAVLRVNNLSRLTRLHLEGVLVPGQHLLAALSQCRSSLRHVHISYVRLINDDQAWQNVFHVLASMPQLHQVILCVLRDHSLPVRRLVFKDLMHGNTAHDGRTIAFEGEEQIVAGLKELTATPVSTKIDDDTVGRQIVYHRIEACSICGDDLQ